ncbi:hypothetical protein [Rhodospirillum centenum]|uniref:Uncharacterized protein n=1 Tax=Rhodospirillum centenum (strain ATCC 51521 / SW) TaxID=414684 RepID=B6IVA7_RHOCS|nr:hypothetical protein [Rhodospirillum centenum]ACJ00231.1 hypothetical protein RC1_2861 [Rhodospirillum centenum SW]
MGNSSTLENIRPEMSETLRNALDTVEQMGMYGLTAVPVKPTAEMLLAGARAGGIGVETAWAVYQAMLKAAD